MHRCTLVSAVNIVRVLLLSGINMHAITKEFKLNLQPNSCFAAILDRTKDVTKFH